MEMKKKKKEIQTLAFAFSALFGCHGSIFLTQLVKSCEISVQFKFTIERVANFPLDVEIFSFCQAVYVQVA